MDVHWRLSSIIVVPALDDYAASAAFIKLLAVHSYSVAFNNYPLRATVGFGPESSGSMLRRLLQRTNGPIEEHGNSDCIGECLLFVFSCSDILSFSIDATLRRIVGDKGWFEDLYV